MAERISRNGLVMCAMAIMALLSVAGQAGRVAGRVIEEGCPTIDYAYPFQSTCQYPAQFDTPYHLVAPFSNALVAVGGLTPSEDHHVRFTGDKGDEGAQYVLKPALDAEGAMNITLGSSFRIQNVATKRYLAYPFYAELGTALHILSEVEEDFVGTHIAEFALEVACEVPLPCGSTHGARCLSYNLKDTDLGTHVFPVHRDGVTYAAVHYADIVQPAITLPLLLRRVKSDDMLTQSVVVA